MHARYEGCALGEGPGHDSEGFCGIRLDLRPGQVLEFREERGRLIGTKRPDVDPIRRAYGVLKMGETTDEALRRLRGRADAT